MTATEQERRLCEPEGELLRASQGTGVGFRRESQELEIQKTRAEYKLTPA